MNFEKNFIRKIVVLGFVAAVFLAASTGKAQANLVTYNYVGDHFAGMTTPGVTGTLTIDTTGTLPPDGPYGFTLTALTLTAADFGWSMSLASPPTNLYWGSNVWFKNGQITSWALGLLSSDTWIETYSSGYGKYDNARKAVNGEWVQGTSSSPGTWTFVSSSPVPLPATVLLFAPGLACLVALKGRQKR